MTKEMEEFHRKIEAWKSSVINLENRAQLYMRGAKLLASETECTEMYLNCLSLIVHLETMGLGEELIPRRQFNEVLCSLVEMRVNAAIKESGPHEGIIVVDLKKGTVESK